MTAAKKLSAWSSLGLFDLSSLQQGVRRLSQPKVRGIPGMTGIDQRP